jgi:hypothetical protein
VSTPSTFHPRFFDSPLSVLNMLPSSSLVIFVHSNVSNNNHITFADDNMTTARTDKIVDGDFHPHPCVFLRWRYNLKRMFC